MYSRLLLRWCYLGLFAGKMNLAGVEGRRRGTLFLCFPFVLVHVPQHVLENSEEKFRLRIYMEALFNRPAASSAPCREDQLLECPRCVLFTALLLYAAASITTEELHIHTYIHTPYWGAGYSLVLCPRRKGKSRKCIIDLLRYFFWAFVFGRSKG